MSENLSGFIIFISTWLAVSSFCQHLCPESGFFGIPTAGFIVAFFLCLPVAVVSALIGRLIFYLYRCFYIAVLFTKTLGRKQKGKRFYPC